MVLNIEIVYSTLNSYRLVTRIFRIHKLILKYTGHHFSGSENKIYANKTYYIGLMSHLLVIHITNFDAIRLCLLCSYMNSQSLNVDTTYNLFLLVKNNFRLISTFILL
ncbi:hypothetical protein QTP88_022158 [Uroleucon formosanum]